MVAQHTFLRKLTTPTKDEHIIGQLFDQASLRYCNSLMHGKQEPATDDAEATWEALIEHVHTGAATTSILAFAASV